MNLFLPGKDLIPPFSGFLHGLPGQVPGQHHGGRAHLYLHVRGQGQLRGELVQVMAAVA